MRAWQVIKLGEGDYAAHGILVQGPRCEDEKLVSLRDVVGALRGEWAKGRLSNRETQQDAADFIERKFGGSDA